MPNNTWKTDVHERLAEQKKGPLQMNVNLFGERRVPYGAKSDRDWVTADIEDYGPEGKRVEPTLAEAIHRQGKGMIR